MRAQVGEGLLEQFYRRIGYVFVGAEDQPPNVVEADELGVLHEVSPPLLHQLVGLGVDSLEEPVEAVLRLQRPIVDSQLLAT